MTDWCSISTSGRSAKLPGSGLELYEKLDRPALQSLPCQPYVFAEWKKERVRLDYHVELDGHHYSVPYQLVQQLVKIRYTVTTVEVLRRGKRVASHARSQQKPGTTTVTSHQPKSHQGYREWTPSRLLEWAGAIGPFTQRLVENMLIHKPPSGSQLPRRDGSAPTGQPVWSRAAGGCLHTRGSLQTLPVRQCPIDPGYAA